MTSARFLALAGFSAALLYVITTIAGSVLDPSYSQLRQHVSDLTASGAATRDRLVAPYLFYNALVAAFALALWSESSRGRLFTAGLLALLLNAFAGVMMVSVFPEDLGGVPMTLAVAGHLFFAGISVLCTLAIAFVHGVAFRPTSRALSTVSLAIGAGILVFGPLAIFATAARSDLAGLAERTPIGLFLAWIVAVSAYALYAGERSTAADPRVRAAVCLRP